NGSIHISNNYPKNDKDKIILHKIIKDLPRDIVLLRKGDLMDRAYEALNVRDIKICKKTKGNIYKVYRRSLDIVLSLLILIIGIPLMLIFGLAVIIETDGPMFYSQERVGKMGKTFRLYKLRSMVVDAEKNG